MQSLLHMDPDLPRFTTPEFSAKHFVYITKFIEKH